MAGCVVAIFGATGVGKTSLSLALAGERGEIISVDSRQVYKYLDIGTAKPDRIELSRIKHHLIGFIEPNIQFSAGDFKRHAEKKISQILKKNKIPFLVGGTGLYFKVLINGIVDIEVKPALKEYVRQKWIRKGQKRFYAILTKIDPIFASKIHPNDKQRTMRAIEVYLSTGKPLSYFHKNQQHETPYHFIKIGLDINRDLLYQTINRRVDLMIEMGLVDEVEKILAQGYRKDDPGLKTIGYQEIIRYLNKEISLAFAIKEIKKNTRRYAKRQLTWFRYIEGVKWFQNSETSQINHYIKSQIKAYND